MSFVSIARRLLSGGEPSVVTAPAVRRAALAATRLEDRTTPVVSLVDGNVSITGGGNGTSQLLGLSADGRYAIFSSTSTDLVQNPQDTPNSSDVFWTDLLQQTVKLVSALPASSGNASTTSISTLLGPMPTFGQAAISADGQFVAFTSKINASKLDQNYLATDDSGNSTLDVFRWNAKTFGVELVSRTFDDKGGGLGRRSKAFGSVASSSDPALSSDGAQVSFVSTFNARNALPLRNPRVTVTIGNINITATAGDGFEFLVDDNAVSKDVYFTDFNVTDSGGFFGATTEFRTNILTSYGGDTKTYGLFNGTILLPTSVTAQYYRAIGLDSGSGVVVDPLGRYYSGDGKTAVILSSFDPANLTNNPPATQNRTPRYASNGGQTANFDVFRITGTTSDLNNNVQVVSTVIGGGAGTSVGSLSTTGGTAQQAIVVAGDSQLVVFAAAVGGSPLSKQAAAGAGTQELYIKRMDAQIGQDARIVTAVTGNSTTGFQTPSGGGLQDLDLDGVVDPMSFSVTSDGSFVAFATTAKANLLVPTTKVNNTLVPPVGEGGTGTLDIFVKDTNVGTTTAVSVIPSGKTTGAKSAFNPTISADGRFVSFESNGTDYVTGLVDKNGTTDAFLRDLFIKSNRLLSETGNGLVTGNKGIVVGQTLVGSNGLSPNPFAVFASQSTNLTPTLPLAQNAVAIFSSKLSTAVTPQVSNAQLVGAISAGNGQVAFVTYDGQGNTVVGNRFTPFPGFTGELRLATYQVTVTDANGVTTTTTNMFVGAGPGAGGPRVAIIDGAQAKVVRSFLAFEASFNGGVYVAAGNNTDGSPVLSVGAGEGGGARLKLLTLNPASAAADPQNDFRTQADFFSFEPTFRGGVRPALGDFGSLFPADNPAAIGAPSPTADGVLDLVAAAGEGGGPRVSIFDGARLRGSIPPQVGFTDPTTVPSAAVRLTDFFVFETRLRNGAYVAAGDFNNDGLADLVAGAGPGGGPRVTVFDGKTSLTTPVQPTQLVNFFAFDPNSSRSGVRVAVKNIDGDFSADIMAGSGAGTVPEVRTFGAGRLDTLIQPTLIDDFIPFNDPGTLSGAWVG